MLVRLFVSQRVVRLFQNDHLLLKASDALNFIGQVWVSCHDLLNVSLARHLLLHFLELQF